MRVSKWLLQGIDPASLSKIFGISVVGMVVVLVFTATVRIFLAMPTSGRVTCLVVRRIVDIEASKIRREIVFASMSRPRQCRSRSVYILGVLGTGMIGSAL